MLDGLQERIGLGTIGRGLAAAKQATKPIQAQTQSPAQVVERFQGKGQAQGMSGAFEGSMGQQGDQESAQHRGGEGVTWEHIAQENGERAATTAAVAARGAEDALAAQGWMGGIVGIVAVKEAVPVQGAGTVAALAALLFEGKSCWFNAS